ncbi:alpha/beta hydrolase domain-containing protein [Frankia sp. EAN1pec]|uniref:alpha/beta hydrolase domain-containing protein n=1 Tax=Parafrankia sp. (strain EAN1pec) TaxID=298653 RepID=UPI0012F88ED2
MAIPHRPRRWSRLRLLGGLVLVLCIGALAACGGSGGSGGQPAAAPTAGLSRREPAPGPAATITGPVTGGKGAPTLVEVAGTVDLRPHGYVESEYFASGTAQSYTAADARPANGRISAEPGTTADYRTRLIVRRPSDPAAFNGTVLVEWLNVTSGQDADPGWVYLSPEIMRRGYAYVAVTAQQVGVDGAGEGGISAILGLTQPGLREADPGRYASLSHPGDPYSYDIFTQVGRALRSPAGEGASTSGGGPTGPGGAPAASGPGTDPAANPLGDLVLERLIAVGESQSAATMSTYANAVQPLTRQFDGFLIHSRGSGIAPLAGSVQAGDMAGDPVPIRNDLDVPVLVFETETDLSVLEYSKVTQPDTTFVRVWEVAGTSHADRAIIGDYAPLLGCDPNINDGPQPYVLRAGLATLVHWVRTGQAPPSAPRLQVAANERDLARDSHGIALGGVRTPVVDVPVAAVSGVPGTKGSLQCSFLGSSTPFGVATIRSLYPDRSAYLDAFTAATDRAIEAGHVLPADRTDLIARAEIYQFPAL